MLDIGNSKQYIERNIEKIFFLQQSLVADKNLSKDFFHSLSYPSHSPSALSFRSLPFVLDEAPFFIGFHASSLRFLITIHNILWEFQVRYILIYICYYSMSKKYAKNALKSIFNFFDIVHPVGTLLGTSFDSVLNLLIFRIQSMRLCQLGCQSGIQR